MPELSPLGLLPVDWDQVCWHDSCSTTHGVNMRRRTRLRVCGECRSARYCCRSCQAADWQRHKFQCTHVASLHSTAGRSICPADVMNTVTDFPEHALGLLASDSGILGAARWRFMRLSDEAEWLIQNGLTRRTKSRWREQLSQEEVSAALDYIWEEVFVGTMPGITMAPAEDVEGHIVVRDMLRSLTRRAAINCVLRLAPLNLVLTLAIRPRREQRQVLTENHSDEMSQHPVFLYVPLASGRIAAQQDWYRIVHLVVTPRSVEGEF